MLKRESNGYSRAIVGLGAALCLFLLQACGGNKPGKVFFFGMDGLSWKVIGPLLEKGELPNFQRLVEGGAYLSEFETMSTTESPVVWTSVATGRRPSVHGVRDFVETLPNGKLVPITSNARTAKAIWEVATDYGISVGVIGWWASWPAEQVKGYVISDHANPAFVELRVKDARYWTADAKTLGSLNQDIYPVDLAFDLERHWIDDQAFPYEDVERRGGFSTYQSARILQAPWNERTPYGLLKTHYRGDYPLFSIAKQMIHDRPTQLQLLYLRGVDPVQHYAWDLVEPEKYATPPPNLARDRGLVEGVYRYLDSFVGELLDEIDDRTWFIVASDHGAEAPSAAADAGWTGRPGVHSPAAKGVLFVYGPHVRPGPMATAAGPLDLLPTMAWLLDLPVSNELPGTILKRAFEREFVTEHPHHSVSSYGKRERSDAGESPADEVLLDNLRALGYLD